MSNPSPATDLGVVATRRAAPRRLREWLAPATFGLFCVVPVVAGVSRLHTLASGGPVTPENARFFADPAPAVVHIASGLIFCVLGALQLTPALRRGRAARVHRWLGRALLPIGLVAAISALWLTVAYPAAPGTGSALAGVRLVAGTAFAACLVLGALALIRRDFAAHGAWMTRAYALAINAGTLALLYLPWMLLGLEERDPSGAVLMGAGGSSTSRSRSG